MKVSLKTFRNLLLFSCFSLTPFTATKATNTPIILQEQTETSFKITVLKSNGEPQPNVYGKIYGKMERFEVDENGVMTFKHNINAYNKSLYLHLKNEKDKVAQIIKLDANKSILTLYIDSTDDLLDYKRSGQTFPIEGMVVDSDGEPLENATVSIQGTGKAVFTDEIGLFNIDADFNHPIVIRADGMDNMALPITFFLQGENADYTITMQRKNSYEVYSSVEKMPEYPGGMKAYQDYLDKNLEYPLKAKMAKIEGVVVVQFVVETDGSITDPQVVRHLEFSLDSAAWRAIKDMPKWIPASDYGKTVRCKYSLPVAFKIPIPKPIAPLTNPQLKNNVLRSDSLVHHKLLADSLQNDSLKKDRTISTTGLLVDSLVNDSIHKLLTPPDSLKNDSVLQKDATVTTEIKAQKRNIFVRFFRWLFGIERRQRKKAEKARSLQQKTSFDIHSDYIRITTDTLDINLSQFKQKIDSLESQKKR